MVDEDDFKGTGSPMQKSPESSSSSLSSVAPQNLKTIGLQESDYKNCQRHKLSVEEDGVKAMMQYLPQSAALLVTALQRSGVIRNKFKKSVDDFYYHEEADDEEAAIPYAEISHAMTSKDGEIVENPPRPSPPLPITLLTTPQMEINERVADMLLESIIRMDDDFGAAVSSLTLGRRQRALQGKQDEEDSGWGKVLMLLLLQMMFAILVLPKDRMPWP